MSYYLIRVGEGSRYSQEALKGGFVAIGWNELGPLDKYSSLEQIKKALENTHQYTPAQLGQQAGQIERFGLKMRDGDKVFMPLGDGKYAVGVLGEYFYEEKPTGECKYQHRRKVQWENKILQKKDMSTNMAYSLGAIMTVFSLDEYAQEIEALMTGKEFSPAEKPLRIRDQVIQQLMELDGKEFEEFIMHLLNIIGFKASTTQYTNDKGIDVIGILDAEGLADITVRVQVKRMSSAIGRKVVQELRGAINRDEHPCIITTSTFHNNAVEEAEDSSKVPVKLVDGDDLASLVLNHFDDLDDHYKVLLGIHRRRIPLEDQFENGEDVTENIKKTVEVSHEIEEIDFDTLVCAAQEDGFKMAFLGQKAWWAVRINTKCIPHIKYLAMYQVAPVSGITYYGEVGRIEPYENNPSKYKLYLKGEPIKLKEKIGLGKNPHLKPQGPRYAMLEDILKAKTLDDIFGGK